MKNKKVSIVENIESGDFLIAMPFLPQDIFFRSVILLCTHSQEGSFGYIMNKRSEILLQEVIVGQDARQEILFKGGPVETNTLHFVHNCPEILGGEHIRDDLYWSGDYNMAISNNFQKFDWLKMRFFIGYSGWSPGQLESEVNAKFWIVCRADYNFVFETEPEKLWRALLMELGGEYKLMSNYPPDPRLN